MAPEQVSGQDVGAAADVFAWGATMTFAATGRPPFGSDSIPAVMYRVLHHEPDLGVLDGELLALVGAALAKDPARRPTAAQLLLRLVGHEDAFDPAAATATAAESGASPAVPVPEDAGGSGTLPPASTDPGPEGDGRAGPVPRSGVSGAGSPRVRPPPWSRCRGRRLIRADGPARRRRARWRALGLRSGDRSRDDGEPVAEPVVGGPHPVESGQVGDGDAHGAAGARAGNAPGRR